MKRILGTPVVTYLPDIGFLIFTAFYLALAYTYNADARAFPTGVAWVMVLLTLLDFASRTQTNIGEKLRAFSPQREDAKTSEPSVYTPRKEILAVAWIFAYAALFVLIGILAAIPVYVFSYVRFRGGKSYFLSIAIAAGCTGAIWFLFSYILRIELYPGLFFSEV